MTKLKTLRAKHRTIRRNAKTMQKRYKNKSKRRMVGGWDNQRYYHRHVGLAPIQADDAIRIGKFLIKDELPKYFLNDDTYYANIANHKRLPDTELNAKLKIQHFKNQFKNDDDYEWLGRQFYIITMNQNPFYVGGAPGYSTFDDGVAFFDWLTNTAPRNNPVLNAPIPYQNPLEEPVIIPVPRVELVGIPAGIVNHMRQKFI